MPGLGSCRSEAGRLRAWNAVGGYHHPRYLSSMGRDTEVAPELLEVVTNVVAQVEGRGLGEFHTGLAGARLGWFQSHRRAEITGYTFTDWSGRSAAASSVDRSLGWSQLRRRLVSPVALDSRPVTSTQGLLGLLAGAANDAEPMAESIRRRARDLSMDERVRLTAAYEAAHRDGGADPWEAIWSLAWLMIGVDPDHVSRPVREDAALIATLLAVQARPYVVSSTAWTLIGYDLLSRPWRTVFGPIGPDDPQL